jgi:hypothetical protein
VPASTTVCLAAESIFSACRIWHPVVFTRNVTHTVPVAAAILLAIAIGCALLRRAFARAEVLPEEVALAAAWVFVVGGLVWLNAFLSGSTLLGFSAPWTWLAASHFAAAGFGALTITALTCRAVSNPRAVRVLRVLLVVHPAAYLVVAAGISGIPFCDEAGAAAYGLLFVTQLGAFVLGRADRIARGPRRLVLLALMVPVGTLIPAVAWAWGSPMLDLAGMVRYHGVVNALGHVGLGLLGFAWGRPRAHSPLRGAAHRPSLMNV